MNFDNRSIGFFIGFFNRHAHKYFVQQFAEFGFNSGSVFILRLLYNKDGIHQSKICDRLAIDKSNVTRNVAKLEKMGYLEICQDEKDSRAKRVYLSEKAKSFRVDFERIFKNWNDIMMMNFSDEDKKKLRELFNMIGENIIEHFDTGNKENEK